MAAKRSLKPKSCPDSADLRNVRAAAIHGKVSNLARPHPRSYDSPHADRVLAWNSSRKGLPKARLVAIDRELDSVMPSSLSTRCHTRLVVLLVEHICIRRPLSCQRDDLDSDQIGPGPPLLFWVPAAQNTRHVIVLRFTVRKQSPVSLVSAPARCCHTRKNAHPVAGTRFVAVLSLQPWHPSLCLKYEHPCSSS